MKVITRNAGACLLVLSATALAGDDLHELQQDGSRRDWQLMEEDKLRALKTWVRLEEGRRVRSWRIDAVLDASVEAIGRLHTDVALMPKWYWETLEARMLKVISSTEFIYYMRFNAPLGLPDRDVVLHARIEPMTPKRGFAILRVQALPDYLPRQPGLVRVLSQDFTVRLTPLGLNRTRFEAEGYVDPGGLAPAWTINFVQRRVPYLIMLSMIRMLQKKEIAEAPTPSPFLFAEP